LHTPTAVKVTDFRLQKQTGENTIVKSSKKIAKVNVKNLKINADK
jgi:hypothetical protein